MADYVVQRMGAVMFIMVAMSILVFLAAHALPSNAAGLILGHYSTPETLATIEHKLGFDPTCMPSSTQASNSRPVGVLRRSILGARSRSFGSKRLEYRSGGSTICESAEITL